MPNESSRRAGSSRRVSRTGPNAALRGAAWRGAAWRGATSRPGYVCEGLEERTLLDGIQEFVVVGTDGPDTISIAAVGGVIVVQMGLTETSYPADSMLTVLGKGGNDVIRLDDIGSGQVSIDAGGGDDTIVIGSAHDVLSTATVARVNLVGGDGDDTLDLRNGAASGEIGYAFQTSNSHGELPNLFFFDSEVDAGAAFHFDAFEHCRLQCGGGSTPIDLASAGLDYTILGGGGDDSLTVSHAIDFHASVTFDGQGGNDTLTANGIGVGSVSITNGVLSVPYAGPILDQYNFASVEFLKVNLKDDANSRCTVSVGRGSLAGLPAVTLAATSARGPLVTLLDIDASADMAGASYAIDTDRITGTAFGGVTIADSGLPLNVAQVRLTTGTGADTVDVRATRAGRPVAIDTGPQDDAISVGPSFDDLKAPVTIVGNSGDNSLHVADGAASLNNPTYTLTGGAVSRNGTSVLSYGSVQTLSFDLGKAGSAITISNPAGGPAMTVNAPAGGATFTVQGSGVPGSPPVTVNGGSGAADRLTFNDTLYQQAAAYAVTATSISRAGIGPVTYSGMEGVTLMAGRLDDTVNVASTAAGAPLTVRGGPSRNTVNLGAGDLSALQADVDVRGAGGSDAITLFDQSANVVRRYEVHAGQVSVLGLRTITYASVEGVTVNAGDQRDTFSVVDTAAATAVTLNGGGGDDSLEMGTGDVRRVAGPVTFDGRGGNDDVNFRDVSPTADGDWTVTASTVTRTGVGSRPLLSYSNVETMAIQGGGGGTRYNVLSTPAALRRLTLQTNGGNDTINLGSTSVVPNILSALDISGGPGTDSLNVIDSAGSTQRTYGVYAASVARYGSPDLYSYTGIENLSISGGKKDDFFFVVQTAAATAVTLKGNGGNDTFRLSSDEKQLSNVAGRVSIDGGAGGTDVAAFFDDASPGAGASGTSSYTLTATTLTAPAAGPVSFSNLEGLTLSANNGPSNVSLNATAANCPVTVNGNGGNDTLTVNGRTLGADVTYDGGDGSDGLTVNGGTTGAFRPSGTTPGTAALAVSAARAVHFSNAESSRVSGFSTFTFVTPNAADVLTIDRIARDSLFRIQGTSGGVAVGPLLWSGVVSFIVDAGSNDQPGGTHDVLTILTPLPASPAFRFSGGGGNDTVIRTS